MANSTVYPYGTNGELPTSIGIINDTTTGGADKALSAQQGKVLGDLLRNARLKKIDFGKLTRSNYSTYSTKEWGFTYGREQHVVLPCSPGDIFQIQPTDHNGDIDATYYSGGNYYGWLTSSYEPPTSASTTPYVSGYDRTWVNYTNGPHIITAPEGAAYLCLVTVNGASTNANNRCDWEVYKIEDLEEAFTDSPTNGDLSESLNYVQNIPFVKIGDYSVAGDGTNYVSSTFGHLEKGATYKVIINDLYWVDNDVVSSNTVFQFDIRGRGDSGVVDDTHHFYKTQSIPSEHTFIAVENNYYNFGGRAKVGNTIAVTLYKQVKLEEYNEVNDDVRKLIRQARNVPASNILGLLHFSDIHGDSFSAGRILSVLDDLSSDIDDAVVSGDVVQYYADRTTTYPNGTTWWQACGLPEKVLFILGNHDGATTAATSYDEKRGEGAWDGKGKEWDFQNYFANYIDEVDYVMPDGYDDSSSPNYHACYWHKDYALQKVRLIGLDPMHRCDGVVDPTTGEVTASGYHWNTNEQELWLIDKLNETLDSENAAYGYSVVVVGHYCLDPYSGDNNSTNTSETGGRVIDHKTSDATNFHFGSATSFSLQSYGFDYRSKTSSYANKTENNFADIINAWKQRGGKFIAFICGHMHYDLMYYPTNYPDLLCVSVNQAGWLRPATNNENRTDYRDRLCANYYAIDQTKGHFKIVRIGLDSDRMLRPIHYICYDYINKKVINEG